MEYCIIICVQLSLIHKMGAEGKVSLIIKKLYWRMHTALRDFSFSLSYKYVHYYYCRGSFQSGMKFLNKSK